MRHSLWGFAAFLLLLGVGFGSGVWFGPEARKWLSPAPGDPEHGPGPPNRVAALGRLRPAGGALLVVAPAGDRVDKLYVTEDQEVERDQELVLLASAAERSKEERLAAEQRAEAEKLLEAIERSRAARMADIDQQLAALDATEKLEDDSHVLKIDLYRKQLDAARSQQRRVAGLNASVVPVSAQEREQLDLAISKAEGELKAAEMARQAARTKADWQRKDAAAKRQLALAELDLARDRVPLGSLRQSEALARRRVELSTLKAPVAGTVLRILTKEGDAVVSQPVLELAAKGGMVVVAEVYASDVDRIVGWLRAGEVVARASDPALGEGKTLTGRVSGPDAVAHQVARNEVPALTPRAGSDRRVIDVRVDLSPESAELARRFIGLQVQVEFEPRKP
jgi:HlyD family secretion protein